MSKQKMIEVTRELAVPFKWLDDTPGGKNLGRAEFQVCVKFRRGRVNEFWVCPVQQHRNDCWHFKGNGDAAFRAPAYGENIRDENIWIVRWCREHKTMSFSAYAPEGAKFLLINEYGISFWEIDPTRKDDHEEKRY